MKKAKLLLVLSALTLAGCDFISITDANKSADNTVQNQTGENTQNNQNNTGNTGENAGSTGTNTGTTGGSTTGGSTTGGTTGETTGGTTGGNTGSTTTDKVDIKDYIPENNPYSLQEWTNFTWHDGRTPVHSPDWTCIYGTSVNPQKSAFWTNPNEDLDYSGVEFKKNTLMISPALSSWLKVELRFTFWFASHTSSSYQASNNQPQLLLQAYNNEGTLLSTQEISIARSDVPNNNTAKEMRFYIEEESMSFFVLKFNNYIPNGSSGYSVIMCDAALKGWPYNN